LIKFVSLMNSAYKEKKLKLWPKNDLINLLRIIQKSVDTHPDLFLEFFPLITNFKITSGKNSAFFDLKSRITVDVDEDASLEMIKKISLCKDMQSIYNTAFNHLMYCLKNNKIHLEDFFAWPVISWLIEKKIVNLEEKTKLSLKLFANPLKVLFVVKTKMILLEFEDGALKSVKQVHSNKIDLKNIWLDLCEKYSFIHFAIRVKKESIKYSRTFVGRLQLLVKPTSIYEFYPKNQFLNELTKKEILDLLLHLAIPFLTD